MIEENTWKLVPESLPSKLLDKIIKKAAENLKGFYTVMKVTV